MLREIIKTNSEKYILHIPKKDLNKTIEILILPFENEIKSNYQSISCQNAIEKTAGVLKSRKIDPVKWQDDIRGEWQ